MTPSIQRLAVRGLQRLVDEDTCGIDVLPQVSAAMVEHR
jgi:DNA-binding FrmR family transcriptional regulator